MTILIIATTPYTLPRLYGNRIMQISLDTPSPRYALFIQVRRRYRLITPTLLPQVLGEGSFAKVYLVKNKATKNLVCSKVMKLRNMKADEQKACWNEVELMKRMAHPNMVSYFDSFLYWNCLCIIMEFCDAGDLGYCTCGSQLSFIYNRISNCASLSLWMIRWALKWKTTSDCFLSQVT